MTPLRPPFTRDPRPARQSAQVRVYVGFPAEKADALMADFEAVCQALPEGLTRAEVARRVWGAGVRALLSGNAKSEKES